jgi:hypothetical protein
MAQLMNSVARGYNLLGLVLFLLGLPIAGLAATVSANEYRQLGINALDCDGPFGVYLVALPALVIYAGAMLASLRQMRSVANPVLATLSLVICIAVGANLARATAVDTAQVEACAATG